MKKHLLALAVLAIAGGAFAQANDTVAKVKASGVITMGVRDSSGALSYTLGDGKYAGYHVEICQRIIANVEKAAGRKLEVKYLPVTSQNRIPLLQNGTVDIECGSTTNNATRQKDVSFVLTTFVEEVRIAVKANSGITSSPSSTARTWPPPPARRRCRLLRKNERATASTSRKCSARTMPTASCCSSRAVPTPS
jgi:glutamate/aspartate transport system substrate-binding protein